MDFNGNQKAYENVICYFYLGNVVIYVLEEFNWVYYWFK